MTKKLILSEEYEQTRFVDWLSTNNYMFTSIPNSTFTRSWSQKAKNTRTGLRKGFPDMAIVLKRGALLFLELKRTKGGKVSPEQKAWLEALNGCGVAAFVAKGAVEAIQHVLEQESRPE